MTVMSKLHSLPIILASASPRRRELLAEAGYRFEVVVPDVDESAFATEGLSAEAYTKRLALAKASSVADSASIWSSVPIPLPILQAR